MPGVVETDNQTKRGGSWNQRDRSRTGKEDHRGSFPRGPVPESSIPVVVKVLNSSTKSNRPGSARRHMPRNLFPRIRVPIVVVGFAAFGACVDPFPLDSTPQQPGVAGSLVAGPVGA